MADLTVVVVSADEQVWSGQASMVVARTKVGEIGILAGHQPLLGVLSAGEVRITASDGGRIVAHAEEGFHLGREQHGHHRGPRGRPGLTITFRLSGVLAAPELLKDEE